MKVDRCMAVLKSNQKIVGHIKLVKIGSNVTLYKDIYEDYLGSKTLVFRINKEEMFAYNISSLKSSQNIQISVERLALLEAILVDKRHDIIVAKGGNIDSVATEKLYEYYLDNKDTLMENESTYSRVSENNEVIKTASFQDETLEHNALDMLQRSDDVISTKNNIDNSDILSDAMPCDTSSSIENESIVDESTLPCDEVVKSDESSIDNDTKIAKNNSNNAILEDKNKEDPVVDAIYSEKAPFYDAISSQLEDLFSRYEREEVLEKAIENSRFSRIYYDKDAYYVVGEIKNENGRAEIVCYGYPGEGGDNPPSDVESSYEWLPLDKENVKGQGYYMMYQNAVTGDILTN